MLLDILTEEKILELCLFKELNSEQEGGDDDAIKFITYYVMKNNPELDDDSISEKVTELLVSYTCANLIKKGVAQASFDDDGEIRYELTDKGNNITDLNCI